MSDSKDLPTILIKMETLGFEIDTDEVGKLIKKYKKLKKFQKKNQIIAELSKLSGIETEVDRLINEYGIDSEAIE